MIGWISVNDRLPTESDGTVLVCMPDVSPYNLKEQYVNAKHNQRVIIARYSEHSNRWFFDGSVSKDSPTHWMPLPEPPEYTDHYILSTVEVAEVRYGEWEKVHPDNPLINKYRCSICKAERMKDNYCPNCGVKMK